jgi:uncharacterized integral membrane protein
MINNIRRFAKIILLILISILIILFIVLNSHKVDISLFPLGSRLEIRLFILIIICLIIGCILGIMISIKGIFKTNENMLLELKKLKKELKQFKKNVKIKEEK